MTSAWYYGYENGEEALRIASDTDYSLHATVFTQDVDRALHIAEHSPVQYLSTDFQKVI